MIKNFIKGAMGVLMQSHLLIAKTIHKLILDSYDIDLSLNDLKIGCIKPDFSPRLVNLPHYKNKSFQDISQMINALKSDKLPESFNKVNSFSNELGVILHYLTDYFCSPHNDRLMDKMPTHFIYELNLDYELRKYLKATNILTVPNLSSEDYANINISLIQYIDEKHNQYLKIKPSLSNDIQYILQVCSVAAIGIITSVIIRTYPKTA